MWRLPRCAVLCHAVPCCAVPCCVRRRLLARLVLMREEVRVVEQEASFTSGVTPGPHTAAQDLGSDGPASGAQAAGQGGAREAGAPEGEDDGESRGDGASGVTFMRRNVPQRCMAFLKVGRGGRGDVTAWWCGVGERGRWSEPVCLG